MRIKNISKKKLPIFQLAIGTISSFIFAGIIVFFPPTKTFYIGIIPVSILIPFFLSFFIAVTGTTYFFFHTLKHGILLGSLGTTYLLFQLNGLTNPMFLILLIALFLALELLFAPQRKRQSELTE